MVDLFQSKAYTNSFFEKSKNYGKHLRIDVIVKEWFPVTQAFCLALPSYTGLLTKQILASEGERRNILEEATLISLAIGSGEFSFGTHGLDGIHYRMFARLGEVLGLSLDDLRRHPRGTLVETGILVDAIQETLKDLYLGAGCIRVVEGTAYNIVDAMDRIFHPMKRLDGGPLFTEHQLEYITLHLKLEKDHNRMATDFANALCEMPEHRTTVDAGVEKMSKLFGNYWEALAQAVFVEDHAEVVY